MGFSFLDAALGYLARGWYVFPLSPRTKMPAISKAQGGQGFKDASNNPAQITEWWTRWPNANIGIACGASNLAVLDIDHGFNEDAEVLAWLGRHGVPPTYIVRTGRRPEMGIQIYFQCTMPDVSTWTLDGCSGQVKSAGGYVMAAGSIHPDSGQAYTAKNDTSIIAPLPDWVRALHTKKEKVDSGNPKVSKTLWTLPLHASENRTGFLMEQTGQLRNLGCGYEAILAHMRELNEDPAIIADPVSEDRLEDTAANCAKFKVPDPQPVVTIGGKKTQNPSVEVDTSEDEDELTDSAKPLYPDAVWNSTFYGEFADMCSDGNYVPKKFFSEALRTVTGAIVGDRLTSSVDGANARAFTVLIAEPGAGKGTACDRVQEFFSETWEGLRTSCEPPLLFGAKDFTWRTKGIGAQIINPASAPGLMMSLEPKKRKKDEEPNPMEAWKPLPRVITIMEEARGLFANFANESTGSGLESVICELYDRMSFSTTATKDRPPASGKLMYSILGGITKEGWDGVFSKLESTESGFLTRVNIIGSEETRRVSDMDIPNFVPLRNRFLPFIQGLIERPRRLVPSPAARALVSEWFADLVLPEGIQRSRLNIHAWRVALHLAWLRGNEHITEDDADGGIQVANYQAKMREYYAPPEGETRQARCEAAIRKVMRARRRIPLFELKRKTNYHRVGIGTWEKSLKALEQGDELRTETVARPNGKPVVQVILLKRPH